MRKGKEQEISRNEERWTGHAMDNAEIHPSHPTHPFAGDNLKALGGGEGV